MNKKASINFALMFLLVSFLIIIGTAAFVFKFQSPSTNEISGHTINVANNQNAIKLPNSLQAVPNENEGTLVIWTKPPVQVFDQFSDSRKYIVFFQSTNIKGLKIIYNLETKKFEAGTPIMESNEIDIFDNQAHQIIYTYTKGRTQSIFIDGEEHIRSDFKPVSVSKITGLVIQDFNELKDIDIEGVTVEIYDRNIERSLQKRNKP